MSTNTIEIQDESGNIYYPKTVSGNVIMPSGEKLVTTIANVNILDNSNFAKPVNQRLVAGVVSAAGYFIDRWKLVSGTVTLTSTGIKLSNGAKILQVLEDEVSGQTTTSLGLVSGIAAASYNNTSKTFTITAQSICEISWAKLEKGAVSTVYQNKGYAVELAECLRYFERIGNVGGSEIFGVAIALAGSFEAGANWNQFELRYAEKRIIPTVTFPLIANIAFRQTTYNDINSVVLKSLQGLYLQSPFTAKSAVILGILNYATGSAGPSMLVARPNTGATYFDISADL